MFWKFLRSYLRSFFGKFQKVCFGHILEGFVIKMISHHLPKFTPVYTPADLGGGAGDGHPIFRDSKPCRPKGHIAPLYYFEISFWLTYPKYFQKAPSMPKYTNFEGEHEPKRRNFFIRVVQKVPKNAFFGFFFQKIASGAETLGHMGFL